MSTVQAYKVVYKQFGDPVSVLQVDTEELPLNPPPDKVLVKLLAAPIHPADINQVQGVYAIKPDFGKSEYKDGAVGGNEGVAEVVSVGQQAGAQFDLKKGDWVVPVKTGEGTWRTYALLDAAKVYKLPKAAGLTKEQAAILLVNPSTAYRLLKDFVELQPGEYVIQNGANSAVGQMVIQLAKLWGLRTINVIRSRPQPQLDNLIKHLKDLGAHEVWTEEQLGEPAKQALVKQLEHPLRLALNCVGGHTTTDLIKLVPHRGVVVTYGGMSQKPVTIPTTAFIFKDQTFKGFWLTHWLAAVSNEVRDQMVRELIDMFASGKLQTPRFAEYELGSKVDKQQLQETVRKAMAATMGGLSERKHMFVVSD